MDWKQLLTSIMRSVDEELRLRNAYLVTENRILRQQMTGRVPLSDSDRLALAEIGQKLGRKALAEIACGAGGQEVCATTDDSLWRRRPGDHGCCVDMLSEEPTPHPTHGEGNMLVDCLS